VPRSGCNTAFYSGHVVLLFWSGADVDVDVGLTIRQHFPNRSLVGSIDQQCFT